MSRPLPASGAPHRPDRSSASGEGAAGRQPAGPAHPEDRRPREALLPAIAGAALVLLLGGAPGPGLVGQEAPPERGTVGAGLLLRQLDGVKRVLVIGAHPDDEDTALLAALDRGWGARAAYLSLTRGEGGQNLIGPELGEGLGIVRTGELLAARRLDGAEQYFSRAYDFGYSKSARETFRHWPRDTLLSDVVWVIRSFRPHVVVSIFSGTPSDGHGQHQVAGILAREAFRAAGDPERFPEQMALGVEPWAPAKLYHHLWRGRGESDVRVETGGFDPLLGRSHHQLAMEGRSQHRSQDMGRPSPPGPRASRLELLARRVEAGTDTAFFAGVDTTLAGLASGAPPAVREELTGAVERYRDAAHRAAGRLGALEPSAAAPALAGAVAELDGALSLLDGAGETGGRLAGVLRRKRRLAGEALLAASSVTLTLRADDDVLVPGETVAVEAQLWNGGRFPVRIAGVRILGPEAWPTAEWVAYRAGEEAGDPVRGTTVPPGELRGWSVRIPVPEDAPVSEPYYLRDPRAGDIYRWPDDPALRGKPFGPPLLRGEARMAVETAPSPARPPGGEGVGPSGGAGAGARSSPGGRSPGAGPAAATPTPGAAGPVEVVASGPVRYRGVDKALGEFWRPLLVVPTLSVELEPGVMVWPAGDAGPRELVATVRGAEEGGAEGRLRLELPAGIRADEPRRGFSLPGEGASRAFRFRLSSPAGGRGGEDHAVAAVAVGPDGVEHRRGFTVIDHPHILPVPYFEDAVSTVRRFPVDVAGDRRIGYIMGSGDEGPEAIRQLGVDVDVLDPAVVEAGDFSGYDVIVTGVRAYEVRPDLRAANPRLLGWVREGGTLIVQYNKYEFPRGGYAPYPVEMSRPHDRVTDETAPVTLLHPDAPVFTGPNRIGAADFEGWVQERGLYFLSDWEGPYVPLLASHDPGESPKEGALVAATVGEGLYVYTGLAFFRQLPAGVPGAYRLFANLLSLTPDAWRGWVEEAGAAEGRR